MESRVYVGAVEVIPLLTQMNLPYAVLIDLVSKTAGERANVRWSDPQTAAGYETWRWLTRFSREEKELSKLGWVPCTHKQIDGIRHDELRMKLVACNMDANTGNPEKSPKSISDKGRATCDWINRNSHAQIRMDFGGAESQDPIDDYDFWYFGVHICDAYSAAEISRPEMVSSGIISLFSPRIIIAEPGEIDGLNRKDDVPEEFAAVEKPSIARKS